MTAHKLVKPFCLVLLRYGEMKPFWAHTNMETSFEDVVAMLASGDLFDVERVLMIHPNRAPEDVCATIAEVLIDRGPLRKSALEFCQSFGLPMTRTRAALCLAASARWTAPEGRPDDTSTREHSNA